MHFLKLALVLAIFSAPIYAANAQRPAEQQPPRPGLPQQQPPAGAAPAAPGQAPAAQPGGTESTDEQKALIHRTCFCKISKDNIAGHQTATGVCQDLTTAVHTTYAGVQTPSKKNEEESDCSKKCTDAAAPYSQPGAQKQAIQACACSGGAPNGAAIDAYRAVGTGQYNSAQQIGILHRTNAVTEMRCPQGWLAGSTNVDGGVTVDGKCKKLSATLTITPLPADGTQLGTYGFTSGNGVWAWGTQANGGAAHTVTISAATCVLQ